MIMYNVICACFASVETFQGIQKEHEDLHPIHEAGRKLPWFSHKRNLKTNVSQILENLKNHIPQSQKTQKNVVPKANKPCEMLFSKFINPNNLLFPKPKNPKNVVHNAKKP